MTTPNDKVNIAQFIRQPRVVLGMSMAKKTQQQPKKVLAYKATQKLGEYNNHAFSTAAMGETQTHSKSHMEMKRSNSHPGQGKRIRRPPKCKGKHSQPTWGNNSPFSTMKPRHTYTVDNGGEVQFSILGRRKKGTQTSNP